MSEPQHPQPHDNETDAGRSAPAVAPAVAQPALESLAAVGARLTQLRELKGGKNTLVKTAATDFADPGTGCRLGV